MIFVFSLYCVGFNMDNKKTTQISAIKKLIITKIESTLKNEKENILIRSFGSASLTYDNK